MTAVIQPQLSGAPGPTGATGAAGASGAAGAVGPQGPAGSGGDLTFVFTQMIALDHWHVVHGLGKYPSVEVVDSAGTTIGGTEVVFIDNDTVDLYFSAPFGGTAYLN